MSRHLDDAAHTALERRHVNTITFENEAKWGPVHPEPERFDFTGADRVADEAQAQGMKMRGHVLIWHAEMPAWLKELTPTRQEALDLLRDHIRRVVGHFRQKYPGLIQEWDVVNEGIDNDGSRRNNLWQRWIGDDYMDHAFRFARAAAGPGVALYYNDYFDGGMVEGAELVGGEFDDGDPFPQPTPGAQGAMPCEVVVKCVAVKELVTGMVRRGVPIDGVGFQAHIPSPTPSDYRGLTAWVGELGLRWAVTELDVPVPAGGGDASGQHQARAYTGVARACIDDPACNTIVTWGLSDRYTWWKNLLGGSLPDALHFREDLTRQAGGRRAPRGAGGRARGGVHTGRERPLPGPPGDGRGPRSRARASGADEAAAARAGRPGAAAPPARPWLLRQGLAPRRDGRPLRPGPGRARAPGGHPRRAPPRPRGRAGLRRRAAAPTVPAPGADRPRPGATGSPRAADRSRSRWPGAAAGRRRPRHGGPPARAAPGAEARARGLVGQVLGS